MGLWTTVLEVLLSPLAWPQSCLSGAIRSLYPKVYGIVLFHRTLRHSFVEDKVPWPAVDHQAFREASNKTLSADDFKWL